MGEEEAVSVAHPGFRETKPAASETPPPAPKQRWRVKDTHGEAYVFDVDSASVKNGVLELVSDGQMLGLFVTWSCLVRVG